MTSDGIKMGMTPPHPGAFMRLGTTAFTPNGASAPSTGHRLTIARSLRNPRYAPAVRRRSPGASPSPRRRHRARPPQA